MLYVSYVNGDFYLMDSQYGYNIGRIGNIGIHTIGKLLERMKEITQKAGYDWNLQTEDRFPNEYYGFKKYLFGFENGELKCQIVAYENKECSIQLRTAYKDKFSYKVVIENNKLQKYGKMFEQKELAENHFLESVRKHILKILI